MTAMACQQAIAQTPQTMAGTVSVRTSGKRETTLSTAAGKTHTYTKTDKSKRT